MKLKVEAKREIIRLNREEGIPKSKLARMYNVGISRIKDVFMRYDLHGEESQVKGPKRKYSPEFKMEIINQYMNGESVNLLAVANNIQWTMLLPGPNTMRKTVIMVLSIRRKADRL